MGRSSVRPPAAPFVELAIYDATKPDREVFQSVLDCLSERGASAVGTALGHEVADVDTDFAGPTDLEPVPVAIESLADVDGQAGPRRRIVSVDVADAVPFAPSRFVQATYLRVDSRFVGVDEHPVALWASGEAFGGPATAATKRVGAQVRELFEAVVDWITPSYGALTVDWPLASPQHLAADDKAFGDYRDFYLGSDYVGEETLHRVERAASGLDVRRASGGLYVYSSPAFGGPGFDATDAGAAFVRAIKRADARWRIGR
jgi:hypothetical protein